MIYLIDFENVHEEGFSALGRLGDKDAVYCFFTRNVAKISMSALAGMRSGQLHFIEAESGKQSLDLVLVSYLGYLIGTRPQELYYDIVSNDNGFAKVAEFWNKRGNGLRVRIRKTTDLKPKAEPVKAQPQPAANQQRRTHSPKAATEQAAPIAEPAADAPVPGPDEESATNIVLTPVAVVPAEPKQEAARPAQSRTRSRQRSQRQRSARQEQQTTASVPVAPDTSAVTASVSTADTVPVQVVSVPVESPSETKPATTRSEEKPAEPKSSVNQPEVKSGEPKQKTETKPLDAATAAALETVGITASAVEFIQTQVKKYRADKNMKQLVYRAVVKKYGQKIGTQIYNNAKKLLLK